MSIEVATSARMRKGTLQARHKISVSVSNAFRKELKVWEDVYKRDGYIRKGSWLSISVGLQNVVADALISTKEFQELSEREKLMTAFSIGQGIEEEFRRFQSRVRESEGETPARLAREHRLAAGLSGATSPRFRCAVVGGSGWGLSCRSGERRMNNLPKIGSIWSHHTNGGEYVVYDITNENTQNEKYPINISYRGANGRKWSKPLDNFLRTMVESEEWRDPWWFKEPTPPPVQQIKLHGCELCGNLTCRGTCFK